jgi:hypothetical protein
VCITALGCAIAVDDVALDCARCHLSMLSFGIIESFLCTESCDNTLSQQIVKKNTIKKSRKRKPALLFGEQRVDVEIGRELRHDLNEKKNGRDCSTNASI